MQKEKPTARRPGGQPSLGGDTCTCNGRQPTRSHASAARVVGKLGSRGWHMSGGLFDLGRRLAAQHVPRHIWAELFASYASGQFDGWAVLRRHPATLDPRSDSGLDYAAGFGQLGLPAGQLDGFLKGAHAAIKSR